VEFIKTIMLMSTPSEADIWRWEVQKYDELIKKLESKRVEESLQRSLSDSMRGFTEGGLDSALNHLIESARAFECPICRAIHVHMIEYLLKAEHYRKLLDEGVPEDQLKEEYKKRFEPEVKKRVEEVRRLLGVRDTQYQKAEKKFEEIISTSLTGG